MADLLERVKKLLEKEENLTLEKITFLLHLTEPEKQLLQEVLSQLERDGFIYENDSQEYIRFPKNGDLAVGEVRFDSKHRPFVLVGNNMVFVPDNHLNGALKGDIVLVKRNGFMSFGQNRATIEKIIQRQNNIVVFECYRDGKRKRFRPYNNPFSFQVSLSKKDRNALAVGDRFFVEIDKINHNGIFHGDVICLIGHKDDPYLDVKTIAASHGIRIEFPESVLEEVETIPDTISQEELDLELKRGRINLLDKMIFTIDGAKSKDLDDAISLEINARGNYILGVHIADVSYYVKEGSELQKEAFKRGHSYYFLNLVFPMLPPKLSNGICSLNPETMRFTKSCEIEITPEGKMVSYHIFDSVIRSRKKMTYEDVNRIFDKQEKLPEYEEFIPTLQRMFQLSHILDQQKHQRGYISFGDKEIQIQTDEEGMPVSIIPRYRGSSEKLIENFMLLANEVIGRYAYDLHLQECNLPYIYRIHDLPNTQRIHEVIDYLIKSGYPLEQKNYQDPKEFQKLLESLAPLDAYPAISDLLIRGLSKAKYSVDNIGHFGLALANYTHFTSPIRRYSDLQTHYNMNKYSSLSRQELDPALEREKMIKVCKHTTQVEKIADSTDQEITNYKLAQFMAGKEGNEYISMITYISKNHVVIKTSDFVTGTIPTSELIALGYELQEGTTLVHKDTGETLRIGDFIHARLVDASPISRKIQFSIVILPTHKIYTKKGA